MPAPDGPSRSTARRGASSRACGRPAAPPSSSLEVVSVRRADGREVSLAEMPLELTLGTGETVRAEEVVLAVPDGRSVRTLINATPIRAEGGGVGSVVVTMQDLAPLDEIERMRTEFLGLVSHELRAPLIAIKGSADALLEEAAELDPAEMHELHRIIAEQRAHMRGRIRDLLDAGAHRLGHALGRPRALGGGRPGRAGAQHVPQRRRPARRPRRPAGGAAPRDGRPPAHRAGAHQPLVQRREACSRIDPIRVAPGSTT